MLKTSVALACLSLAFAEWSLAFRGVSPFERHFEFVLWVWGIIVPSALALGRGPGGQARGWRLLAALMLLVYFVGLRWPELTIPIPDAYAQSRRAALFSREVLQIPWVMLVAALGLLPPAALVDNFLTEAWPRDRRPSFPLGRILGVTFFGVTLWAWVRYGSGKIVP